MDDTWVESDDERFRKRENERECEFLVSVEIYISNAAGAAFRKPLPNRKKLEKRDAADDSKLKEKSSVNWSALQKGLSSAGHWRTATCRLLEEGDRCMLNVYLDESILYQTVFIHLLNQTNIRTTDNSLFYRKDVLGIFSLAGQRWTSPQNAEPLYLHFANGDTCTTWQTLLKSYAIPEVYGRWFFPEEGGCYRMWRQVELTVIQGRNLGGSKPDRLSGEVDDAEDDTADIELSCEMHLNDILCGRTTPKKSEHAPLWHEAFTFSDLPTFERLDLTVYRERKSVAQLVGKCAVELCNFRRGDTIEGWFPVVCEENLSGEIQLGELRLKIRVDEEIVLPYSSYTKLMDLCTSRNFLDWIDDLENKLKLKSLSFNILSVALSQSTVLDQVVEYARREIKKAPLTSQTLFRGNTTLTKVIEMCMNWYGKKFLEASVGNIVRRVCSEKVELEVDPMRTPDKAPKDIERSVGILGFWCQEFWQSIYAARSECPNELRVIFNAIRILVEERVEEQRRVNPNNTEHNSHLPWQSISAFCFLRFLAPAILHPHLFGLCAGLPTTAVQRTLTLIAKAIQRLANLNHGTPKELYMRSVDDFIKENSTKMVEYYRVISTPLNDSPPLQTSHYMNRHDRLTAINSVRQRVKDFTILDQEALPLPPHYLDVPRHLAIITSAVIRSIRDIGPLQNTGNIDVDSAVDEFCARCIDVEKAALIRVKQLAARLAVEKRKPVAVDSNTSRIGTATLDPLSESTAQHGISGSSNPVVSPGRQRLVSARPSTAPSLASGNHGPRHVLSDGSMHQNFTATEPVSLAGQSSLHLHNKAPSTDSFNSREPLSKIRSPPTHLQDLPDEDGGKRKLGKTLLRTFLRR